MYKAAQFASGAMAHALAARGPLCAMSRRPECPLCLQELALPLASLRRLAFAAVVAAAALAANGALAAGAAPEPDRTMDMATVLKPGPLPELTVGDPSGVPVVGYGSPPFPPFAPLTRATFPRLR